MLIRLEVKGEHKAREGIYKAIETYVLSEVCTQALFLPVGWKGLRSEELVLWWFTLEGWQKYGHYFVNLLYDPEGIDELRQLNTPIYFNLIQNDEEFNCLYDDGYQKALSFDSCETKTQYITRRTVFDSSNWEYLEKEFPFLIAP